MTRKRKRHDNAHGHDRRIWLSRLLDEEAHRCHWCRRPVVRVRELLRAGIEVLVEAHFDVTWREPEGGRVTRSKATLDHVVPLGRGGSRARSNLVVACARCNHRRNAELHPKTATPKTWRDRHPVPDDERELGEAGW